MKKPLRKFLSWFIITGLIYNFGFTFLVYELSLKYNKEAVNEYFSETIDDQLLILKVSDESSIIRKNKSEIIYDGKTYDVKKEVKKNGLTYIYCYHDVEEENINSILTNIVKSNSSSQSNSQPFPSRCSSKPMTKDFYPENNFCFDQDTLKKDCSFAPVDNFETECFFHVITPPPDTDNIN